MFVWLLYSTFLTGGPIMKGDLVLRIIMSFLIPFLLLFGFFAITSYRIFGFYSLALSFLYFLLVYVLSFLRHKSINSNNIIFFKFFGRMMVSAFIFFLFCILTILLNWKVFFVYEYIKF